MFKHYAVCAECAKEEQCNPPVMPDRQLSMETWYSITKYSFGGQPIDSRSFCSSRCLHRYVVALEFSEQKRLAFFAKASEEQKRESVVREKLKGDTDTASCAPACQMGADFSEDKVALHLWHVNNRD
jgi:hypothetical protein